MKICKNCKGKNEDSLKFCGHCGKKLPKEIDNMPKLKITGLLGEKECDILRNYAKELVEGMVAEENGTGYDEEDTEHYLMEEVVQMFYGKDAFDVIYRRKKGLTDED